MFILVTVDTEIFPVGAIRRIVQVVSVLVMNRQKVSVLVVKLSTALPADQAVNLERTFPVVTVGRLRLLQVFQDLFDGFISASLLLSGISAPFIFFQDQPPFGKV